MTRTYTAEERAAAVGLAMSIGPLRAARQLGIPPRTLAHWRRGERHGTDITPIVAASRQELARMLWQGVEAGVTAVLEGLHDPRQRLADRARALEVVMNAHALLTGGPTSRVQSENVNVNVDPGTGLTPAETADLRKWLDSMEAQHPELFADVNARVARMEADRG
jgi:transposase-like protein